MASASLSPAQQQEVKAFQENVVAPSMDGIVILDFYADWCGPCKELTPVLEKVAAGYDGQGVTLAKVDVDANRFIADQFRVRSIPTVYAVHAGKPVADLTQARTEPHIRQLVDKLIGQYLQTSE